MNQERIMPRSSHRAHLYKNVQVHLNHMHCIMSPIYYIILCIVFSIYTQFKFPYLFSISYKLIINYVKVNS